MGHVGTNLLGRTTIALIAVTLATFGIVGVAPAAQATCTLSVLGTCSGYCEVNVYSNCASGGACKVAIASQCSGVCVVTVYGTCGAQCQATLHLAGPCYQSCRVWLAGCLL